MIAMDVACVFNQCVSVKKGTSATIASSLNRIVNKAVLRTVPKEETAYLANAIVILAISVLSVNPKPLSYVLAMDSAVAMVYVPMQSVNVIPNTKESVVRPRNAELNR